MRIGSGYKGSESILVTPSSNYEIIPSAPPHWTLKRYIFYKFSIVNYQDCKIKINGDTDPIFLSAEQGFEIDDKDAPIYSLIIVESGINYQWIGAY